MDITACRPRPRLAALLAWCLVLLLSWGLMLWQLDASDLTYDEATSFRWASRPLSETIPQLQEAVREHPPTYYLLLRAWIAAAGSSEYSLRLFTAAAGMMSLVLTGWVARLSLRCFGGIASIIPVTLLAITPGLIYYARVARMYQMVVALPLLSAGLFLRGFLRKRTWPHWCVVAGLALVHLAAISTHYYLALPLIAQPLILLLTRRWKPLAAWCCAQAVPALAALTWYLTSPGLQLTVGSIQPFPDPPTGSEIVWLIGKLFFSPVVGVEHVLLAVLLALIGVGIVLVFKQDRTIGAWLLLSLVIPFVVLYLIAGSLEPRLVLYTLPFLALALGTVCTAPICLGRARCRSISLGSTAVITLVAAWLLGRGGLSQAVTHNRSNYGRTLETIEAFARPGDVILFYGPWQQISFDYYDPGGLPPIVALPERAPPRLKPAEAEPVLRRLAETYERIWVLPAAVADVDPLFYVGGWLRNNAHNVWDTGSFDLYLPALPPEADVVASELVFGNALKLASLAHEELPIPAGEALRLTLTWRPMYTVGRHLQMTLTLVDQNGHVRALARSTPGHWAAATDTWRTGRTVVQRDSLIVPEGAPPGSYTLRLMVSDAATGDPLLVNGDRETHLLDVNVSESARMPVLWGLPGIGRTRFCSPDESTCVELVGSEPGGHRFQQGQPVPFKLHWVAEGQPLPGVVPHLSVTHDPLAPWARETLILSATLPSPWSYAAATASAGTPGAPEPASGTVETPELPYRVVLPLVMAGASREPYVSGRLVTAPDAFVLPPDARTGRARVGVGVLGPDGQAWKTAEGETLVSIFAIDIEKRPTLRRLPADLTAIEVDFGETVALRGYRVRGDPRPGGELEITFAWYAKDRPTQIFSVFNHLMDANETLVAQADGWPLDGRILTTQWQPGEYLRDTHAIQVPADAPPGPYRLYVGLYDASTHDRPFVIEAGEVRADGRLQIPLPGRQD